MRYASVCDGIGAAHVAWRHLGWECAWTSEIEPFPATVVDHHFAFKNVGDMTKITEEMLNELGAVDLLVGGTPCQSFSVAGLRGGLDDPRGNLALRFVQLAAVLNPEWIVWENVPGVLSSGKGRDFGTFLGALAELGYGFAYRILDAQWFGVAQRRRRVFVVAHARDWRRAAAVLFERESLFGDPPTRGEAWEDAAGSTGDGVARCVTAGKMKRQDWETCNMVADAQPQAFYSNESRCDGIPEAGIAPPLKVGSNGGGQPPAVAMPAVAHALRADGFDASEDGTGRGTPLVPVAFHENSRNELRTSDTAWAVTSGGGKPWQSYPAVMTPATYTLQQLSVRRLTPRECERLQGFPDDYTAITYRNKPAADGPRYKALGNSMAVPVMRWIGQRIEMVSQLKEEVANVVV